VQLGRSLIEQSCRGRSNSAAQGRGVARCAPSSGVRRVQREQRPPEPLARSPPASDECQRTHAGVVKATARRPMIRTTGPASAASTLAGRRPARPRNGSGSVLRSRRTRRRSLVAALQTGVSVSPMMGCRAGATRRTRAQPPIRPDRSEDTAFPGPHALSRAVQQR